MHTDELPHHAVNGGHRRVAAAADGWCGSAMHAAMPGRTSPGEVRHLARWSTGRASRAVGAVETIGEAAVVGRWSAVKRRAASGQRERAGLGRCHRPPHTPERPRARPAGSPHLQRTPAKFVAGRGHC